MNKILNLLIVLLFFASFLIISNQMQEVKGEYTSHEPIYINGNENFTSANGVSSGDGTKENPYIIEGWDISAYGMFKNGIEIRNTDKYFVIRNVYVHDGWYDLSYDGIYFYNVKNGKIENSEIKNNKDGIYLYNSQNNEIINNTVYKKSGTTTRYLIYLEKSSNNIITNNKVYGDYRGIHLSHSSENNITQNNVYGNGYGIYLDSSTKNFMANNDVYSNSYNFYLYNSTKNTITNNHVYSYNTKSNYVGIFLKYSTENILSHNNITANNDNGIQLISSNRNIISNNDLSKNGDKNIILVESSHNIITMNDVSYGHYTIYLESSSDNKIYLNNIWQYTDEFFGYTAKAFDNGTNFWNYEGKGNYWSDYKGEDNNWDGIGDTPYSIPGGNNKDNYPLMRPTKNGEVQKPEFLILYIAIGVIVIIIVLILLSFFFMRRNKLKAKPMQSQYLHLQTKQQSMQQNYQPQRYPSQQLYQPMPQNIVCPNCQSSFQVSSSIPPINVQCPYCGLRGELK